MNISNLTFYSLIGKHDLIDHNDMPGPGTYNLQKNGISAPKFGFGTSERKANDKTDSPGPGTDKVPV